MLSHIKSANLKQFNRQRLAFFIRKNHTKILNKTNSETAHNVTLHTAVHETEMQHRTPRITSLEKHAVGKTAYFVGPL
jgi:hypothetical protein